MNIAFACDHAGFEVKDKVMQYLKSRGYEVIDFGCQDAKSCNYPDHGIPAAFAVSEGKCEKGILICGSGVGMSILANKTAGIRAGLCWTEEVAKLIAEHNNANILCLPARFLTQDRILKCIAIWLDTPFSTDTRHANRISKVMDIENRKSCCCGCKGK
jgi:ribose 5-phosphate isomerase B